MQFGGLWSIPCQGYLWRRWQALFPKLVPGRLLLLKPFDHMSKSCIVSQIFLLLECRGNILLYNVYYLSKSITNNRKLSLETTLCHKRSFILSLFLSLPHSSSLLYCFFFLVIFNYSSYLIFVSFCLFYLCLFLVSLFVLYFLFSSPPFFYIPDVWQYIIMLYNNVSQCKMKHCNKNYPVITKNVFYIEKICTWRIWNMTKRIHSSGPSRSCKLGCNYC